MFEDGLEHEELINEEAARKKDFINKVKQYDTKLYFSPYLQYRKSDFCTHRILSA